MYSKILITGGAGFIGSYMVDHLLSNDLEVVALDNLSSGSLGNLIQHLQRNDFKFIQDDIRNLDAIKNALEEVDAVFHAAAISNVPHSIEDPNETNDVNVCATIDLLKACLNSNVKRFVYPSSASVYGEVGNLPITEESPLNPISPYAASKLAAECYVRVFGKVYGIETVCLRYFNVYGPRQPNNDYSGVITLFINRLLNNEPPIIYGDGEQTRDFVNIQDVVRANMLAMNSKNAVGGIFNIATGEPCTINRLVDLLLSVTGKKQLCPMHEAPRLGDIRHSYADISKSQRVLEYKPQISLREGLADLFKWYMNSK